MKDSEIKFTCACFIFLITTATPSLSQDDQQQFERLTTDANFAAKKTSAQATFDLPEANKLAEFIHYDISKNHAKYTTGFLRSHDYNNPSWQIITSEIIDRSIINIPNEERIHILSSLIESTIRKNDNWLNYSPPRGWTSPYTFRDRLAGIVIYLKTGERSMNATDRQLLRENPSEWLKKHVPEEVSSSPEKSEKGPQSIEATESRAASAAGSPSMTLSKTTPEFPRWAWWTGAGVLVIGVLAFLLKKRRNRS